ncbi:MAG: YigZ family protein [Lachnospiraceae bacterium]|nr:YigZ family protein [Lachnospiraceae bacterium]
MDKYRTVKKDMVYSGEITEKKSRFIGYIKHVESEEEAVEFLNSIRKKHYDARHNCSAYIIPGSGGAGDILHSSDDGEPSGTAGKPIMAVIEGEGLKNVILVVTRYFGGTLLGTGGLVRAYTDAAKEAVKTAMEGGLVTMAPFIPVTFSFDYPKEGAVRRLLEKYGVIPADTEYSDRVRFRVNLPEENAGSFKNSIRELLSGLTDYTEDEALMMEKIDNQH